MEEKKLYFHCNNCGVLCRDGETYCHNCGESFIKAIYEDGEDFLAEEVTCKEAREYISHNTDRYIDIFNKKSEDKVYVSKNFASIFLSPFWYLYRRMFKYFFIMFAINVALCVVAGVVIYFCTEPMRNQITQLSLILSEVIEEGEIVYGAAQTHSYEMTQYLRLILNVTLIYNFTFAGVSIVHWLVCGLFGDCLYQKQVYKSVRNGRSGGVSVLPAILIPLGLSTVVSAFNSLLPILLI